MADKDSWWQDSARGKGDKKPTTNPFPLKDTQSDGSSYEPRSIEEGYEPKFEISEKK